MKRRANSKNEPGWAHDATLAGEYEGKGVGDASGTGIWGEVMHGAGPLLALGAHTGGFAPAAFWYRDGAGS